MLLYGRFAIPDGATGPNGQPTRARDHATGRDFLLYRTAASPGSLDGRFTEAAKIFDAWKTVNPSQAVSTDLFSSPGTIWLLAPDAGTVEPLLGSLRAANLFTMAVEAHRAEPKVVPPPPPAPTILPRPGKRGGWQRSLGIIFLLVLLAIAGGGIWLYTAFPGPANSGKATANAPRVHFSADAKSVRKGGTVHLRWETSGAPSVRIDHGIGAVKASDTRAVRVTASTVFTLTASGPGGSITSTIPVSVTERATQIAPAAASDIRPTATLTLNGQSNFASVRAGENAHVCWATTGAEVVTISGAGRTASGCFDQLMNTPGNFHYIVTATGKGGTVSTTLEFTVVQ